LPDGRLDFIFTCSGELRATRQKSRDGNWRVVYMDYRAVGSSSIPQQIRFADYRHRVKLSLWLAEVKQENE
jgi:outer membrane biogenesis lipoprotein LolB